MIRFDIHEASLWYGDELYIADGLDSAIIGVAVIDDVPRVCYSREKVIDHFMKEDGMSEEEAVEFAEFNVFASYIGKHTPLFIDDFFNTDEE